jgi:hypothetical protein
MEPPPDNNNTTIKQWTKGLGRKWPGGIVWAAIRTSPFYHVVIMVKKGCLGLVAVVSNQRFRLKRETRHNSTSSGNDRFGANQNMTKTRT